MFYFSVPFPASFVLRVLFFFIHKWETNIWMCLYFSPLYLLMLSESIYYFKIALVQTCQILKQNHLEDKIRTEDGGGGVPTSCHFLRPEQGMAPTLDIFSWMLYMCKLYHGQNHEHCSKTRKYAGVFCIVQYHRAIEREIFRLGGFRGIFFRGLEDRGIRVGWEEGQMGGFKPGNLIYCLASVFLSNLSETVCPFYK